MDEGPHKQLDDDSLPLHDRCSVYIDIVASSREESLPGAEFPTLSQLGEYVDRHPTNVGRIREAKHVDVEVYDVLLLLAGIYPPPPQGQPAEHARRIRLAAAYTWHTEQEPEFGTLHDWLFRVLDDPAAYGIEVDA